MSILQFIADIFRTQASIVVGLVWPITLIVLVVVFREQVLRLIQSLKTLAVGNAVLTFEKDLIQVERVVDRLPQQPPIPEPAPAEASLEATLGPVTVDARASLSTLSRFDEVVSVSPRLAVIEEWIAVEEAVREFARRKGIATSARANSVLVRMLVKLDLIDSRLALAITELRQLRNSVAHSRDDISLDQAYRYRDSALQVLYNLAEA